MRLRTERVTTAACSRGPNALAAIAADNAPLHRRAARAAHTLAAMLADPDGHHRQFLDLMTRRLAGRHPVGLQKTCPHVQSVGQCSTTSSTAQVGSSGRPLPSWPS